MIAMSLPLIKGEIEEGVVVFTISPTTPSTPSLKRREKIL
jgi:hypothetical protein